MFNDPNWATLKAKCRDGQIAFILEELGRLQRRVEELEKIIRETNRKNNTAH